MPIEENRLLRIIDEVRVEEGIDVNSYHLPIKSDVNATSSASVSMNDTEGN